MHTNQPTNQPTSPSRTHTIPNTQPTSPSQTHTHNQTHTHTHTTPNARTHTHTQNNLDPEKFLRAPRSVIEHTLAYIEKKYGSINDYLDSIGVDAEKRARLQAALRE